MIAKDEDQKGKGTAIGVSKQSDQVIVQQNPDLSG